MFEALLASLMFEVGASVDFYEESLPEDYSIHLKLGKKDFPVYMWGSYSEPEAGLLGQRFSKLKTSGIGLGAKKDFDDISVFLELGYAINDPETVKIGVQQEVVYTYLVGRHNVYNRPVPLDLIGPYDQRSYETSHEVDDAFMGRIGIGYQVFDHLKVTGAYKYHTPNTKYQIWDQARRDAGGGWWQESGQTNLNSFEFAILYSF